MAKINLTNLGKNPVRWEDDVDEETGFRVSVCVVGDAIMGEVTLDPNNLDEKVLDRPWKAYRGFGQTTKMQKLPVRIKNAPPDWGCYRTKMDAQYAFIRSLYHHWRTGGVQLEFPYVATPKRVRKGIVTARPPFPKVPTQYGRDGDNHD